MTMALLLPGLGLVALALWHGVERRRKLVLGARCVGIYLAFVVTHLVVDGPLEDVTWAERTTVIAAGTAVAHLLWSRRWARLERGRSDDGLGDGWS